MCSPLATTETATMRRVFVGLARCSWASRRNYEITASSRNASVILRIELTVDSCLCTVSIYDLVLTFDLYTILD